MIRRYLTLAFLLTSLLWSSPTHAVRSDVPRDLVMSLPKMCWSEYIESVANNPDYMLQSPPCGVYTNHFCPGLLKIVKAERLEDLNQKLVQLRMAKDDMNYTLHFTEAYPECTLRPLAQRNLIRIENEIELIKIRQKNQRSR